jgi:hypothetical protein
MLFDLQSRGRRNFVKVIYLGLAILMGGGLLLFGIGTGTGGGGFLDIFSNGGSSTSSQVSNIEKKASRAVRLHPQSAPAWANLTRAHYQAAEFDQTANQGQGQFTKDGVVKLDEASVAWERYLKLEPDHPDATLARLMANAYSQIGLDQPADAAAAMELVTEQQPSASAYATLAQYAYVAQEMRRGDLAAAKAVQLAPSAQKRLVRAQLANVRRQVVQQEAERAIQDGSAGAGKSAPKGGGTQGVG